MDAITALAMSAGSPIAGAIGNAAAYGIGKITGVNDAMAKDQFKQQEKLSRLQQQIGNENIDKINEYNLPKNVIKRMKDAGLNPALMYGNGAASVAGGTTTAASASGSNASDEASRMAQATAQAGMGLQLMKLKSEIEVNQSVANANNAQAGKAGAETNTIEKTRQMLFRNLEQDFRNKYMQNSITEFKSLFDLNNKDENWTSWDIDFGDFWIEKNSSTKAEIANAVLKTYNEANATKTNAEANTMNAETNRIATELQKQLTDFQTGRLS